MRGLTVIELVVAITIIGLLLLFGTPWITGLADKVRSQTDIQTLKRALSQGRSIAINQGNRISICPYSQGQCVQDWNNAFAIFEDSNADGVLDVDEHLHSVQGSATSNGYWITRSNNSGVITYFPQGFSFNSATTFVYCPNSGDNQYARQLVINFQGRIKTKHYLSSKGDPYSSLGTLTCR